MSFKRRVLSALGKDVLLEIGRGLDLDVTTRMSVEELRDALAKSKRAKLDAIVQESLSRDTLKDICGAVGLDDTGKEKAALVERILAAGGDKAANGAGYRIDPAAVRGSTADLCSYWFRRAHDRLKSGGRAGLVGTSGIRVGKTREASLDYIAGNSGTITDAVSSRVWPGQSAVNVSMVNWVRGPWQGPFQLVVDDRVFSVERIAAHLQLHADVSETTDIAANRTGTAKGVVFGHEAFRSCGPAGFLLRWCAATPSCDPSQRAVTCFAGGSTPNPTTASTLRTTTTNTMQSELEGRPSIT
jgi:hypothetical protein